MACPLQKLFAQLELAEETAKLALSQSGCCDSEREHETSGLLMAAALHAVPGGNRLDLGSDVVECGSDDHVV